MNIHGKYILRCLDLAAKGLGNVAPNPMVGCVIVLDDKIIGEGYHQQYGEAHAEVNAIDSIENKELLKKATLYVNLEPCAHFGKTPPCADLIIQHQIPFVVIGAIDSNEKVSGKGIEKLKNAGVDVTSGILQKECKQLNKRFFTYHEKKRPYIILKWAQTIDGFIDENRSIDQKPLQITNEASNKLSHLWRSQEQAIMVGKNTALLDNPKLTVRNNITGKNPLRIVTDRNLSLPKDYFLLDKSTETIVFTAAEVVSEKNLEYVKLNFDEPLIPQLLNCLWEKNIQSILIEGGTQLLNSFITNNCWDEARAFIAQINIKDGVNAPSLELHPNVIKDISGDKLLTYFNPDLRIADII